MPHFCTPHPKQARLKAELEGKKEPKKQPVITARFPPRTARPQSGNNFQPVNNLVSGCVCPLHTAAHPALLKTATEASKPTHAHARKPSST